MLPLRFGALGAYPEIAVGVAILVAMLALGPLLKAITGYSTSGLAFTPLQSPTLAHPFGTDMFGRDVMVRTFVAAQTDFLVAAIAVGFASTVGTLIGVFAGSTRIRGVDWTIMRIVDAIISFPFIVLVLALVVVVGADRSIAGLPHGLAPALIAFCLTGWAYYARIARGQALSLRQRDFVVAARLMGYSELRIVVRHILPAVLGVTMAYAVGDAIITVAFTASLSLLGAGVQPPTPEWGSMMYEARNYLQSAWWITLFPALALVTSGIAFSLVGDGLLKRLERDR